MLDKPSVNGVVRKLSNTDRLDIARLRATKVSRRDIVRHYGISNAGLTVMVGTNAIALAAREMELMRQLGETLPKMPAIATTPRIKYKRTTPLKLDKEKARLAALLMASGERSVDVMRHFQVGSATFSKQINTAAVQAAKAELAQLRETGQALPALPAIKRADKTIIRRPQPKLSEEEVKTAAFLVLQGNTKSDVARHYGVNDNTFRGYVTRSVLLAAELDLRQRQANGEPAPELPNIIKKINPLHQLALSKEQVETCAFLIASGHMRSAVAEHYKVSDSTLLLRVPQTSVKEARQELDRRISCGEPLPELPEIVSIKKRPGPELKLNQEQYEQAADYLVAGYPQVHVAKHYGISARTLRVHAPESAMHEAKARRQNREQQGLPVIEMATDKTPSLPPHPDDDGSFKITSLSQAFAVASDLLISDGGDHVSVAGQLKLKIKDLLKAYPRAEVDKEKRELRTKIVEGNREMIELIEQDPDCEPKTVGLPATIEDRLDELDLFAIPLRAVSSRPDLRGDVKLPFGWTPPKLWNDFKALNSRLYDLYLNAEADAPALKALQQLFLGTTRRPENLPETGDHFMQQQKLLRREICQRELVSDVFLAVSLSQQAVVGELRLSTLPGQEHLAVPSWLPDPSLKATRPIERDFTYLACKTAARQGIACLLTEVPSASLVGRYEIPPAGTPLRELFNAGQAARLNLPYKDTRDRIAWDGEYTGVTMPHPLLPRSLEQSRNLALFGIKLWNLE